MLEAIRSAFHVPFDNSRRRLIGTGIRYTKGAIAATTVLPALDTAASFLRQPQVEKPRTIEDIVADMKRFEESIGNAEVSFEEARNYVPLITEFFSHATGIDYTPQELEGRVYILEGNWEEEMEVPKNVSPFERYPMTRLSENYPLFNMGLPAETAVRFMRLFGQSRGLDIPEIGAFMYLDFINTPSVKQPQYVGEEENLVCLPYSPIVRFRTTLIHELFHDVALLEQGRPLEQDMENLALFYLKRNIATVIELRSLGVDFEKDKITLDSFAFQISIGVQKQDNPPIVLAFARLNEFITDYLTMELVKKYDFIYPEGGYTTPYDSSNFKKMLVQAHLNSEELFAYYQGGFLREFLMRMGQSAQHENLPEEFLFADESAMLAFMFRSMIADGPRVSWVPLQKYFPNIDMQHPACITTG